MENEERILWREDFPSLFEALKARGYRVAGPTVADGAIVYGEIDGVADLPIGWTDEQEAGRYRLRRRDDGALFGYAVGPHSWKKFLHEPHLKLFGSSRAADGTVTFHPPGDEVPKFAFLGVRSCELNAIAIQDRVFLGSGYQDSHYAARREHLFTIAVNCVCPSGTCFCVSMQTGPRVKEGTAHDLALTELSPGTADHRFLITAGSERGRELLAALPVKPASSVDLGGAEDLLAAAAGKMGRRMETENLKEVLYQQLEHPRWEEVAQRCLTCANCTMVCPTCFCTTVEDVTDLTGENAERWRRWDSCFTLDFSYLHGGGARQSAKSRYRQWLTHKLAYWHDQFGSSGCVGCGRCIAWCPVGIDITEEVAALRQSPSPSADLS